MSRPHPLPYIISVMPDISSLEREVKKVPAQNARTLNPILGFINQSLVDSSRPFVLVWGTGTPDVGDGVAGFICF
jgi:hypothetical protein